MKILKVNSLCSILIMSVFAMLVATSCKKNVEEITINNANDGCFTLYGNVVELLDVCSGNEYIVALSNNDFNIGINNSSFGSNVIAIPPMIRVTRVHTDNDNNVIVDDYEYNYYMADSTLPSFQVGDSIGFECRAYNDSLDCKYFTPPNRCDEPTKPDVPRYVVTKILSVY